jgi:hypothetical protein
MVLVKISRYLFILKNNNIFLKVCRNSGQEWRIIIKKYVVCRISYIVKKEKEDRSRYPEAKGTGVLQYAFL